MRLFGSYIATPAAAARPSNWSSDWCFACMAGSTTQSKLPEQESRIPE